MTIQELLNENIKATEIITTPENVKISKHYKNLEYKNKWISLNREKVNQYAKNYYIKKINELGDEYRHILCEKNKRTYKIRKDKKDIESIDIIKNKVGRPKKIITDEIKPKKKNGRPIIYNNNIETHII